MASEHLVDPELKPALELFPPLEPTRDGLLEVRKRKVHPIRGQQFRQAIPGGLSRGTSGHAGDDDVEPRGAVVPRVYGTPDELAAGVGFPVPSAGSYVDGTAIDIDGGRNSPSLPGRGVNEGEITFEIVRAPRRHVASKGARLNNVLAPRATPRSGCRL